jgi:glycosyltransferase involved in cell wall biosynthesis
MKILMLTPHLPEPARQGTALRNGAFLRHLSQQHSIDLLTFLAPGEILEPGNPLFTWCHRVAAVPQPARSTSRRMRDTLFSTKPDMGLRLVSNEMATILARWLRDTEYDIVQIEGIEMIPHAQQVDVTVRSKIVFDNHNAEYLLQKRNALSDLRNPLRFPAAAYSMVQWGKLRRYEEKACLLADAVIAVSQADADALRLLNKRIDPTVITNGIDLDHYHLAPAVSDRASYSAPTRTVIFTGKMDYRPNIDAVLWFAREVLPLIRKNDPDIRFDIVGRSPHHRLDVLGDDPAIRITGGVEDTRPYLWHAGVSVIPLRVGGGTRFKALEAMACGLPVVSTELGVEGIGVEQGRHMLLANDPHDFADAVRTLLAPGNQALRGHLIRNARSLMESSYGWTPLVGKLNELYRSITT